MIIRTRRLLIPEGEIRLKGAPWQQIVSEDPSVTFIISLFMFKGSMNKGACDGPGVFSCPKLGS